MTEEHPVYFEDEESEEEILLYRRVKKYAKAAFIVAIAILALSVVNMLCYPLLMTWRGGEVSAPDVWRVLLSTLRTVPVRPLMLAGLALIALLVARAALFERRPHWAPVLDDAFIRKADIFVLVTFVFACVYTIGMLVAVPAAVIYSIQNSRAQRTQALISLLTITGSLEALLTIVFTALLGVFIVRALLLIAVKEPDGSERLPRENIHE